MGGGPANQDAKLPPSPPVPLGEPASAVHLEPAAPQEPYRDFVDDYDDQDALLPSASNALSGPDDGPPPEYGNLPDNDLLGTDPLGPTHAFTSPPKRRFTHRHHPVYMDPRFESDPSYLESWLYYQATYPPRSFVSIKGTHTERVHRNDKWVTETVTDFNFSIELTAFLYSDVNARKNWSVVRTADNLDKVRRGTVFRGRAPGFGGSSTSCCSSSRIRLDGEMGGEKPTLREWCHRYSASHAGLRTFVLRKRLTGLDTDALATRLQTIIRETGYRGTIHVDFPLENHRIEIFNEARTNIWRLTSGIRWLFFLTLLFLFTWPYLWLRTKRYEVVFVDWEFSRLNEEGAKEYVSVSEEGWVRLWGRGIQRAALNKAFGVLDHTHLSYDPSVGGFPPAWRGEPGIVGVVRNAITVVNRQFGWGHNS